MNLIRSMPGVSWMRSEQIGQPRHSAVAHGVLVAVDGLAQQRDFLAAFAGELATSAAMCSGCRLCSGPRTLGTMQ